MVAQEVLVYVLDNMLHLLHPFAPFMTEEIWQHLKNMVAQNSSISIDSMKNESLMISQWPKKALSISVSDTVSLSEGTNVNRVIETMPLLQDIVRAVRNIRRNVNIPNKQKIKVQISANNNAAMKLLDEHNEFLEKMANMEIKDKGVNLNKSYSNSKNVSEVVGDFQIFALDPSFDINVETQKKKQQEHLNKVESHLGVVQKKLHNESFVKNAPEEIVNAERDREAELLGQITKIKEALQGLEKSVPN
jgi:valyl-tRNA synthetase